MSKITISAKEDSCKTVPDNQSDKNMGQICTIGFIGLDQNKEVKKLTNVLSYIKGSQKKVAFFRSFFQQTFGDNISERID